MSSGACRALVAWLIALTATLMLALPLTAATERLREQSTVIYKVDPTTGSIRVDIVVKLTNNGDRAFSPGTWGPLILEELAVPRLSSGFEAGDSRDVPGLWRALDVTTPQIEGGGDDVNLQLSYALDASIDQNAAKASRTPARVGEGYIYLCLVGQDTDIGLVRVEIVGKDRFKLTQSGTVMEPTTRGLKSTRSTDPAQQFTCIEGTVDENLVSTTFPGPDDRQVVLQAWPEADNWLDAAEANARPTLDAIAEFLDIDIPGDGPVVIRQSPSRDLGGYASAHDTPGIVQLDESAGVNGAEHELAHAWFTTDDFIELWLREGLAEWTATAMAGEVCPATTSNASDLLLSDWQVVRPTAGEDIDQVIVDQEAAACGIMTAVAERMGDERWHTVLASLLDGETKYIGSSGPGAAATTRVDYREWLDAVDERGLVPAAEADATHAANMDDLDYAQDLLAAFGIPTDPQELEERSAARERYHQFLADAAPLGAPLAVREAMDDWRFDDAQRALDKADEVLGELKAADALLPAAGLIPFIQPAFEDARSDTELEAVLADAQVLRESAGEVVGPLGELQAAAPDGWSLPTAVRDAMTQQRFDDIKAALAPALATVTDVAAADAALPMAGIAARYRSEYEAAASVDALEELASQAAGVRGEAERAGAAYDALVAAADDWTIPDAVTSAIESGQLEEAVAIAEDAQAVVAAAAAADAALPDAAIDADLRARFERVTDAAGMAELRSTAEAMLTQAETVGSALASLSTLVPDWQVPAIVTTPVSERDFTTAAQVAAAAQRWVENAWQADQKLPAMDAIGRVKPLFEAAASLDDLKAGADLAASWNLAADSVQQAEHAVQRPRDLLATLGMLGTDVQPDLDAAVEAAVEGNVERAGSLAATVIETINGAGGVGGLRLAGVIFFGVAMAGIIGMWVVFRRQRGPSWARQSKPHWIKNDRKRLRGGK